MIRWSTPSSSNLIRALAVAAAVMAAAPAWALVQAEQEPMTLRVVAVNPSSSKTKTVPVRIDLPQEIKPGDILEHGDLEVEFDTERSLYYVFKDQVTLAPKQTKVFEVIVRDVWFILDTELEGLKSHTQLILKRLVKSEYYETAKALGESIISRLTAIQKEQTDETISRKQRIGAYRKNLQALAVIREDLARLEKMLSFAGGPPVPDILEESPLKSDSPSTTTTWLVIFLIIVFMGLLAGQFFFTWQRHVKATVEAAGDQQSVLTQGSTEPRAGGPGEQP